MRNVRDEVVAAALPEGQTVVLRYDWFELEIGDRVWRVVIAALRDLSGRRT